MTEEKREIIPLSDTEYNALIFQGVFPSSFGKCIQPDSLAKSGSEHGEQVAFFAWAARAADYAPALGWAYATPNGGSRGDTERSRAIEGGKMKAEGVKSGVPDVFLPHPRFHVGRQAMYAGAYCELKTKDGGDGGSDNQKKWLARLSEVGYACTIANGWHEMRRFFVEYLEIQPK
jgi:hypothetical protein